MHDNIIVNLWGITENQSVNSIKIINSSGAYIEILTYGATIISVVVPDNAGLMENVVLGYKDLEDYLQDEFYMGSTIGRYANRISNARFQMKRKNYQVEMNDGLNSNHGGFSGYHTRVFNYELCDNGVSMTLVDKDGTGGFPGTIEFKVIYHWNDNNELSIRYEAVSDELTIANFTNHSYFNLSARHSSILRHNLWIDSEHHLETNEHHLPTGKVLQDGDDFYRNKSLHEVIKNSQPISTGLNRYYILSNPDNLDAAKAVLSDPDSGRQVKIFTSYPGIMVYTGQYLNTKTSRDGHSYKPLSGICLECQHYPDGINQSHFPSTYLHPGDPYSEFIRYQFSLLQDNK